MKVKYSMHDPNNHWVLRPLISKHIWAQWNHRLSGMENAAQQWAKQMVGAQRPRAQLLHKRQPEVVQTTYLKTHDWL